MTINYCLFGSDLCLSPEAWAAWAQAIGSVAAILVAIAVAAWQSHASRELLAAQRRQTRVDIAQTLSVLADESARLVAALNKDLRDRELIYFLADSGHPGWPELQSIEGRLDILPVHELPARLVRLAMALSTTVRQYRGRVERTLREHRQMDAEAFMALFDAIGALEWRLLEIVGELDRGAKEYASGKHG